MAKRSSTPQSQNNRLFDLGFLILVIAVPLVWSSDFVFVTYYPKLLALYIGTAILYLSWIIASPHRVLIRPSSLTWIATLYVGLTVTSILWAINRVEATLLSVHHIGLLLLFFVLLNTVRVQNLTRHIRSIVTAGVIVAIIGIIQYAGWGLHWIPSAGFPSGTLGYRNFAAMYTILCIPLALLLFLETRRETSIWGWALCTSVLITFLLCTRTRGAWAGLTVAATIGIIALLVLKTHDNNRLWRAVFANWTRQHIAPAGVCICIAILFHFTISPNMQGRGFDRNRQDKALIVTSAVSIIDRSKDERSSVQDRLTMWQHTQAIISDHPLLGVGAGNWQTTYPAYDKGDIVWEGATPRRPHNDYLWVASEIGISGLLIYLAFLITALFYAGKLITNQNRSRVKLPLAFGISILALATHAMFSFPRERIAISTLFWILITFLAVLQSDHQPRTHHKLWPSLRIGGLLIALLGIGVGIRAVTFDTHFGRASKAIDRNDWTQVIRETTAALDNGVIDPQALLVRGVAHAYMGNTQKAVADNLQCLTYHPHFLNALNNMGTYYNTLKQYDKATQYLHRALEINPNHPDAHANLGIAYQGQQNYDASVQSLKKAFELEPANSDIRAYLAKAYYSLAENQVNQSNVTGAIASYTAFLNIWRGDKQSADTVRQKLDALNKTAP